MVLTTRLTIFHLLNNNVSRLHCWERQRYWQALMHTVSTCNGPCENNNKRQFSIWVMDQYCIARKGNGGLSTTTFWQPVLWQTGVSSFFPLKRQDKRAGFRRAVPGPVINVIVWLNNSSALVVPVERWGETRPPGLYFKRGVSGSFESRQAAVYAEDSHGSHGLPSPV